MFVPSILTQVLLPISRSASRATDGQRPPARATQPPCRAAGHGDPDHTHGAAEPVIAGLYGPEFRNGAVVFAVLFLTAAIGAPHGALGNYLVADERMWTRFHINLLWAAVLVAGAAAADRARRDRRGTSDTDGVCLPDGGDNLRLPAPPTPRQRKAEPIACATASPAWAATHLNQSVGTGSLTNRCGLAKLS